jgi:hypothetical protein
VGKNIPVNQARVNSACIKKYFMLLKINIKRKPNINPYYKRERMK